MDHNPSGTRTHAQKGHAAAGAWGRHAGALAAWTDKHLVNRRDAFGHYIAVERRRDPILTTFTDKAGLTPTVIERHYRGKSTGDVIGLHSSSLDGDGACLSRWIGLDIDRHGDAGDPEANLRFALAVFTLLVSLGFRPLLFDSNGRGGYHLLILFDRPIPTEQAFRFARWLVRGWKEQGLGGPPETFPKQEAIRPGGYGNWLRLPGRHHTRDHWTRVWDGSRWLEGIDAIRAILATEGTPATAIPAEALAAPKPERKPRRKRPAGQLGRDAELAREALEHLKGLADDYEQWIDIGMCLTQLGAEGLALWDEWSQVGEKYQEGDCERKWRTFRPDGGLTLGTLFFRAKERGYEGPGRNGRAAVHPGRNGNRLPPHNGDGNGDGRAAVGDTPPPAIDGGPPGDGDGLPQIVISTIEHAVIDQAVAALATAPDVFQRANALTTVLRDPSAAKRIIRFAGSPRIAPLPIARLRELLTKVARWVKPKAAPNGLFDLVPAHPADWAVSGVAARGQWPGIRLIEAVTESPVLRPDGTILDRAGYDETTGLLYEPNAEFPPIDPRPTLDDARRAADELLSIVVDFPFAGDAHRAAWLAGLLTPIARFAIDGPCPMFLIDANTPGTGKSMLTDVIAMIASGREMTRTTYPDNDEEMRKRITSIALVGDRLMLLDNIAKTFGGSALDSALTARTWRDRLLSRSEMTGELPLFTVWYGTGNNVTLRGDVVRRIVWCRLESPEERPDQRQDFTINGLLAHVRENRPRLVAAALTLLRAHAVAGRPRGDLLPFGSFEAWSGVVRSAVHWTTGLDPCRTGEELRASDPEAIARAGLVAGWADLPDGRSGLTAAAALKLVKEDGATDRYATLREALMYWGRKDELPSANSLGMRLNALKGRVIDGMMIQSDTINHTQHWRVEFIRRDDA